MSEFPLFLALEHRQAVLAELETATGRAQEGAADTLAQIRSLYSSQEQMKRSDTRSDPAQADRIEARRRDTWLKMLSLRPLMATRQQAHEVLASRRDRAARDVSVLARDEEHFRALPENIALSGRGA